jgi:PPOX class probable FMN-dependent enzyme
VLASGGPSGLDCSPRGDQPGFARVMDEKTLLIPDRRGNNRVDSLQNILDDPRVGLLFLIPGVGETLRINGRAAILINPELLDSFMIEGKRPRSVLAITVDAIYFQCARAIVRSELWNPEKQIDRTSLPSLGEILSDLSHKGIDGAAYEHALPERRKTTLW